MKKLKKFTCLMSLLFVLICSSSITSYGQAAWITFGGQSKRAAKRSFEKGRRAAIRDLKKGRLGYRTYGLPDNSTSFFNRIMKDDYGVEVDWFAGCVAMPWERNAAAGYNSVMLPIIERKYGKGILNKIDGQAMAASKAGEMTRAKVDEMSRNFALVKPTDIPIIISSTGEDADPPPPPPHKKN